jgi:hypothetical protein
MPIQDKDRKARAKYRKKVKRIYIELYPSEADLIEHLEKQEKVTTYIKDLIREDMKKG